MTKTLDVITVGSALRDVMYYTSACVVKNNKQDLLRQKLMCVEYGAKISSNKVHFEFGGGASNTAINISQLGLRTGILAAIGFDLDGRGIKEYLEHKGIDTTLLQITQGHRTGFSFLVVDENRGEHSAFVYYGATRDLLVRLSILQNHPTLWYYLASLNSLKWRSVLKMIFNLKNQSKIAWNPGSVQLAVGYKGLKEYIAKTDIIILNKDEATELILSAAHSVRKKNVPQMLKLIQSWGPKIVLITCGRHGAYAFNGQKIYYVHAGENEPVDTTGAGDCYGSTFVAVYHKTNDIELAMHFATLNSNSLVKTIGAQKGLLNWEQLSAQIESRKKKKL